MCAKSARSSGNNHHVRLVFRERIRGTGRASPDAAWSPDRPSALRRGASTPPCAAINGNSGRARSSRVAVKLARQQIGKRRYGRRRRWPGKYAYVRLRIFWRAGEAPVISIQVARAGDVLVILGERFPAETRGLTDSPYWPGSQLRAVGPGDAFRDVAELVAGTHAVELLVRAGEAPRPIDRIAVECVANDRRMGVTGVRN